MTLVKPTLFQLALALFVERTKPPSSAIRDYINQLKYQLSTCKDSIAIVPSSINANVNFRTSLLPTEVNLNPTVPNNAISEDVTHWTSKCAELTGRVDACNIIISDHERTIEALKARLQLCESWAENDLQIPQSQRNGSEKRKIELSSSIESRGSKRRKVDNGGLFDGITFPYPNQSAEEEVISAAGERGQKLLQQLYHIQEVFQQEKPNVNDIAQYLTQTSAIIASVAEEFTLHRRFDAEATMAVNRTPYHGQLPFNSGSFFHALSGAIVILRRGHNRFASLQPLHIDQSLANSVTQSYLKLFHTLIQCLNTVTRIEFNYLDKTPLTKSTSHSRIVVLKIKERLHSNPDHYSQVSTHPVPASPPASPRQGDRTNLARPEDVSRCLLAIMPTASEAPSMSPDIAEGLAYLLLTRAGELIYHITFGQPRASTIEAEIRMAGNSDDSRLQEIQAEGAALLPVLARLLPITSALLANSSSDLAAKAKAILQRTLVSGIFGDFCSISSQHHKAAMNTGSRLEPLTSDHNDKSFRARMCRHAKLTTLDSGPDQLKNPFADMSAKDRASTDLKGSTPARRDGSAAETPDFVRSVWELCGWEILKDFGFDGPESELSVENANVSNGL